MLKKALGISVLAGIGAVLASGTPIPGLVSTGTGPTGSADPAWAVAYSATPGPTSLSFAPAMVTVDTGFPFPYWVANSSVSKWVSPNVEYGPGSGVYDDAVGYYFYQLSFNLGPGYDPATGTFTFRFSGDNWLTSIWLNSTQIVTGYEGPGVLNHNFWTSPITVTAGPGSGLVSGVNNLVVVVYNTGIPGGTNPQNISTWNPGGLRFEVLDSSIVFVPPQGGGGGEGPVIPEPAAFVLCGLGLASLGWMKLRRA